MEIEQFIPRVGLPKAASGEQLGFGVGTHAWELYPGGNEFSSSRLKWANRLANPAEERSLQAAGTSISRRTFLQPKGCAPSHGLGVMEVLPKRAWGSYGIWLVLVVAVVLEISPGIENDGEKGDRSIPRVPSECRGPAGKRTNTGHRRHKVVTWPRYVDRQ